jgi:tRNA threonylcarbamoyladenosine biosynthesis protein TsaE
MSHQTSHFLADEAASGVFGRQLAACLAPGMVIYLEGDLGAGKTTLVRALLRALGHQGPVKSPTYTLVEVYVISSLYWYHFDFYRFNHPEEFVDAGLGEYFRSDSVCLVEWPDKAAGFVPPPDLVVALEFQPFEQSGHDGRRVTLSARSPEGEQCLNTFLTTPAANSSALPVAPPSSSS